MTDNTPWQSPEGTTPPPPPRYGEFAPPTAPESQQETPQQPPQQSGWTPPPKPGLIPLRPMTLGAILGGAFRVMRRNPRPTFGISLIINAIIAVISISAYGLVTFYTVGRIGNAASDVVDDVTAGSTAISILSQLATIVLTLLASAILQGIISLEVSRATLGEKLTAGGLWKLARGRIGSLLGWALLAGVVSLVGLAALVFLVVIVAFGTFSVSDELGIITTVLVSLVAFAGAVVLVAWIATRVSLVPSALLIERLPLTQAIVRSWTLTRGHFWRVLGIQLLVQVIINVAAQIVITPVVTIMFIATFIANPTQELEAMESSLFLIVVVSSVIAALIGSVTAIITSATSALLYIDLRMRKEGLDLELTRFVEARQVGDTRVLDPFTTTVPSSAPSASVQPSPKDSPWA